MRFVITTVTLFSLSGIPAVGGVISQTTCVIRGHDPLQIMAANSGLTSCSAEYSYPGGVLHSTQMVDGSLAASAGDVLFTVGSDGFVSFPLQLPDTSVYGLPFSSIDGYTSASLMAQGVYTTPGPLRPGVLLIEVQNVWCSFDADHAALSIMIAGASNDFAMGGCPSGYPLHSWQAPIELGTPFEALFDFEAHVFSDAIDGGGHSGSLLAGSIVTISAFDLSGQRFDISQVTGVRLTTSRAAVSGDFGIS